LWIERIPSHWQVRKLRHIASVKVSNVDKKTVEGQRSVRLCNYVDVYKNEYIIPSMDLMEATATDEQIRQFTLRANDVLITKDSETWDDIAVPAYVGVDLEDVICGYHLAQVRPLSDRVDGEYLFRCFQAEGICDQFRVSANGITRFGLGKFDIAGSLFPVPPLHEQQTMSGVAEVRWFSPGLAAAENLERAAASFGAPIARHSLPYLRYQILKPVF
jgi:type I restriction enzyme S subunit